MLTLLPPILEQKLSPSFIYMNGDGVKNGVYYDDELYIEVTQIPQASHTTVLNCVHQLYVEGQQIILTLQDGCYTIWSRLD